MTIVFHTIKAVKRIMKQNLTKFNLLKLFENCLKVFIAFELESYARMDAWMNSRLSNIHCDLFKSIAKHLRENDRWKACCIRFD